MQAASSSLSGAEDVDEVLVCPRVGWVEPALGEFPDEGSGSLSLGRDEVGSSTGISLRLIVSRRRASIGTRMSCPRWRMTLNSSPPEKIRLGDRTAEAQMSVKTLSDA